MDAEQDGFPDMTVGPGGTLILSPRLASVIAWAMYTYRCACEGETVTARPKWRPEHERLLNFCVDANDKFDTQMVREQRAIRSRLPRMLDFHQEVVRVPTEDRIRVEEAASILGITAQSVRRLLASGAISGYRDKHKLTGEKVARVAWIVSRTSVEKYRDEHRS